MATGGGESLNPAIETFRRYSAELLTAIQDPNVLAWELYSKKIISKPERDSASYTMHETGSRTSKLLAAVEAQIAVDTRAFDLFLSILAEHQEMSDLCERMKGVYGR